MPAVEAAALGTPVIASDIDTHREILGDSAIFVSPRDKAAWFTSVEALAAAPHGSGVKARFHEQSWNKHFSEVEERLVLEPDVAKEDLRPYEYIVVTTKNVPDIHPTVVELIEPAITPSGSGWRRAR